MKANQTVAKRRGQKVTRPKVDVGVQLTIPGIGEADALNQTLNARWATTQDFSEYWWQRTIVRPSQGVEHSGPSGIREMFGLSPLRLPAVRKS